MSGTGGFQTQVFDQPAIGVAGDRYSQNPVFSFNAGPGSPIAGSSLFVGRFAWVTQPLDPNGAPSIANSFGNGAPQAFLMKTQQALNTTYLSFAGMQVQQGYGVGDLMVGGDFLVVNDGTTEAEYGNKAFAYVATGKVAFAPAGTVFGGATSTGSSLAPATFSVTGSVSGNVLTVTAVGSGTVVAGATIANAALPTTPGPLIVSQLTGTAGGVGTYSLNVGELTVAAGQTITGTYGLLTIGTATGTYAVGDVLTGTGGTGSIPAGATITQILTGTGGSGSTMAVNPTGTGSPTTLTASLAVETQFYARSTGLAGEVVKMSSTQNAGGG